MSHSSDPALRADFATLLRIVSQPDDRNDQPREREAGEREVDETAGCRHDSQEVRESADQAAHLVEAALVERQGSVGDRSSWLIPRLLSVALCTVKPRCMAA